MKKLLIFAMLAMLPATAVFGQTKPADAKDHTKEVFVFTPSDDMFYMRESAENQAQWARLSKFVTTYKEVIREGSVMVYVTSYSTSLASAPSNRLLAKTMANRVKTELILKDGLKEEDFKTQNKAEKYEGKDAVVVVEITIPQDGEPAVVEDKPAVVEVKKPEPKPEPAPAPAPVVVTDEVNVVEEPVLTDGQGWSRWTVGVNAGVPLFDGDFSSFRDKLQLGYLVGAQVTYQACPVIGFSLTADYGQNKATAPKYGKDYLLSDKGVAYFFPEDGVLTKEWQDLYQKTTVYGGALHLDINLVRLFSRRATCVNVILSPGVYGQNYTSKIYNESDDKQFVTSELSGKWNVNFGSDLAFRFRASQTVDFQLKGSGIWIGDNEFDNIKSDIKAKDNWMWGVQAGVLFKLGGKQRPNMLYKE
jgi:hypothetical protein